ncbi:MAG: filamentous hemagglutinin N-terminal domain-containing protein [Cyanobacteria bacterium P01_B01_bin.77]
MTFELLRSYPDTTANIAPVRNNAVSIIQTIGSSVSCLGVLAAIASPGIAQIVPDNTAGTVVTPNGLVDGLPTTFIEGGTSQGANLFQSFTDFNVDTGQRVYFANPATVENILSRVTGGAVSDIDGLLGVNGDANLFLLNPNGVIFGPSARLDINGSFTTSTASSFVFADGSEFWAIPQVGELFSASVPLGVQFNDPSNLTQGDITSTGILETGQDLALAGNNLYLEGQLLTGGDLMLLAQDTVTIRDTAADAFVANAGGDLTIQGNQGVDIWTLQHLEQTPFVSGGDLRLISDGVISGDAHFESGGSLLLMTVDGLPGNFVSFYDPIISADGDVVFGNYTGVALKVEATGSIQGGNIVITGPDDTFTADDSGSDEDLLASGRAVILRAGVDALSTNNMPPQTTGGTTFNSGSLTNQPRGSIVVGSITTESINGDGGPIILAAAGNVNVQNLDSSGFLNSSDQTSGGNIEIQSTGGSIKTGNLDSSSFASNGSGGSVLLRANGNINTGDLKSSAFSSIQSSGDISITSSAGDIQTQRLNAGNLSGGNGGAITLNAFGDITTGDLDSFSFSFLSAGSAMTTAFARDGGEIEISSTSGDVYVARLASDSSVLVDANRPSNLTSNVFSGRGGDISITARNGSIQSRNGREVAVSISTFSVTQGGTDIVNLPDQTAALNLLIAANILEPDAELSSVSSFRTGGDVELIARDNISGLNIETLSLTGSSGDVFFEGTGDLTIRDIVVTSSASSSDRNSSSSAQNFRVANVGASGAVEISGPGHDLILDNVQISSDVNRTTGDPRVFREAGIIELKEADSLTLRNTEIRTNAEGINTEGGLTEISDIDIVVLDGTSFISNARDSSQPTERANLPVAEAGFIVFENIKVLVLTNGSQLIARAQENANGGNIEIINTQFVVATPNDNNDILATAEDGSGGIIDLKGVDRAILGFNPADISSDDLQGLLVNDVNDINSNAQSGDDGSVEVNNLDVDPSQGITELPADLTDRTNQITASCGIGNNDSQSEFVITGRGGLPPGPNDSASANQVDIPWVTYTEDTQTTVAIASTTSSPLVEAQQIAIDAEGNAYFAPHGNRDRKETLIASGLPPTEQCAVNLLSQH